MIQPQIQTYENLRGINTKKTKTQRAINEADDALNGFLDTTGAFIKRRGYRHINETELSTNYDINSVYQFNDLAITAGSTNELISLNLSSLVETVLSSTITGSFFDFEEFIPYAQNYLFLTNGKDNPLKYNGTTLSQLSIDPPSTLPTGTPVNGAGTLTSTAVYKVTVTFLRDNGSGEIQESNPSTTGGSAPYTTDITVTLGAADDTIDLTVIPVSSDPQVTGRNIYLSRPNGAILYKYSTGTAATIADNVTTTFTLTTNVDVLINSELEYNHDPAPKAYLIEKYKNMLVVSGNEEFTDRVYISTPNNVWYFPQGILDESNKFYFSIGEKVNSIKSYYDLVFVFGNKGNIFILQGDNVDNFTLTQVKNDQKVTALSDRATITQDNWCYFLSEDGYYRTNGQIIQKMSEPLTAYFDPENQENAIFNVSGFSYGFNQIVPVATYYKNLNLILIWITQNSQNDYVNNICFVLHLSNIEQDSDVINPNYTIYTGFATRCTGTYIKDNFQKYFLTSQSDGFLFEAEKGRYDGAAVNSTVTSATPTTLTDTTQTWVVDTYAQLWCVIRSGTGAGQYGLIISNTVDTLTFLTSFDIELDSSSEYSIGGIAWLYTHSYTYYGNKSLSKRLVYTRPRFVTDGDAEVTISYGYDFNPQADLDPYVISVSGDSLWDVSLWDVALWDGTQVEDERINGVASRIHRASTLRVQNYFADQSVEYDGHDKCFQIKGSR